MQLKQLIISYIILAGLHTTTVSVALDEKIISSLLEHGIKSSEKSDLSAAINDFSRTLLLDINNDIAIDELLKILSKNNLPFAIRFSLLQVKDLSIYISRLDNTADYYSKKIKNIENILFNVDVSEINIQPELNKLILSEEIDLEPSCLNIAQQSKDKKDPLTNLITQLTYIKKRLEHKILLLRSKYEGLMKIHGQATIAKRNAALNRSANKEFFGTEFKTAKSDDPDIDADFRSSKNNIIKSKNNIRELSLQLDNLKSELQNKDLVIKKLSSQIVDISLHLAENQNKFKDKSSGTAGLNFEITDLNSRLELGQKIIQEKNDQIRILQSDLNKIREISILDENKFNETLTIKNKQLIEQNGILRIYKAKYWDAFSKNKSNIANIKTLEAQIDFAQKIIFEKERIINKFKQNMVRFEDKLFEAENELSNMNTLYDKNLYEDKILIDQVTVLQRQLDSLRDAFKDQILEFDKIYSTFASDRNITPMLLLR